MMALHGLHLLKKKNGVCIIARLNESKVISEWIVYWMLECINEIGGYIGEWGIDYLITYTAF